MENAEEHNPPLRCENYEKPSTKNILWVTAGLSQAMPLTPFL